MTNHDVSTLSRRSFVRMAGASLLGVGAFALAGCGQSRAASSASASAASASASASASAASASASSASTSAAASSSTAATSASSSTAAASSASTSAAAGAASKSLVVYFSHTGENYGVGIIEEGNTAKVAKIIAEKTGADLFEIVPTEDYSEGYDACCDVALAEQNNGARPTVKDLGTVDGYDTIYLGYPIWWGDLPMCVYTYLEAHQWQGKTIHPFCTHAGSGLSGTPSNIQSTCAGATVQEGLSLAGTTAQNDAAQTRSAVESWLA